MDKATEFLSKKRYGRLVIVSEIFRKPSLSRPNQTERYVTAVCDCGTKRDYRIQNFWNAHKPLNSCGCVRLEKLKQIKTKHGLTPKGNHHPLATVWFSMKQRCYNPNDKGYKNYGGRGITVCDQWLTDFAAFYSWAMNNGWQKHLQIDRKDVNGNYEPNNCRFVDSATNARNKRNNVLTMEKAVEIRYLHENTELTHKEIAAQYGISRPSVTSVINNRQWT